MLELLLKAYKAEPRSKTISKLLFKGKWEKEGGLRLQLKEWEEIKKNNNVKCTTSINWREFAWKTMIHFFRVPSQNVFTERDTLLEKIALK